MNVYLMLNNGSLTPAYKKDFEAFATLKSGVIYKATISQPRNPRHHNLAMAILGMVVDNDRTGRFPTKEAILDFIKYKLGMIDSIMVVDGVSIVRLKSISFESMGQDVFKEWYTNAVQIVCEILDVTADQVEDNLRDHA